MTLTEPRYGVDTRLALFDARSLTPTVAHSGHDQIANRSPHSTIYQMRVLETFGPADRIDERRHIFAAIDQECVDCAINIGRTEAYLRELRTQASGRFFMQTYRHHRHSHERYRRLR
jgi:hypothetical protein